MASFQNIFGKWMNSILPCLLVDTGSKGSVFTVFGFYAFSDLKKGE